MKLALSGSNLPPEVSGAASDLATTDRSDYEVRHKVSNLAVPIALFNGDT